MIINKRKTFDYFDFRSFCNKHGYNFDYLEDIYGKQSTDKRIRTYAFYKTDAPIEKIKESFPNLVVRKITRQYRYAPEIKTHGLAFLVW